MLCKLELLKQLTEETWSIREMLNDGPFNKSKNKGSFDEHFDKIIFITEKSDFFGHGKPFWSISDSDDRGLEHFGPEFLLHQRLINLEKDLQRMKKRCFTQENMIELLQQCLLCESFRPPNEGGQSFSIVKDHFEKMSPVERLRCVILLENSY